MNETRVHIIAARLPIDLVRRLDKCALDEAHDGYAPNRTAVIIRALEAYLTRRETDDR